MRKFASVRDGLLHCRLLIRVGIVLLLGQSIVVNQVLAAGNDRVVFDLPSQPLSAALEAYSAVTGRLVLYDGHLTVSRVSTEVKGNFAPDIALQLILKNTGLVARYTAQDAFIITPATQMATGRTPSAIAYAAMLSADTRERAYYGLVQAGIGAALCGKSQTKPGQYRLALQFWIDGSGNVTRPKLLSSTGDAERDTAIMDIIGHASIGESPPVTLAQPLTMVVLPQSSGGGFDCPPSGSYGRDE
jgi:hypothetical protein